MSVKKFRSNLKKSFIFLLLIIFTITLAACGNSSGVPYGSVNDDIYMSLGDIEITKRQVYDEFRLSSVNSLDALIEEKVFADELGFVKDFSEEYLELRFERIVNEAIFGTNDPKIIAEMSEQARARAILRYADSFVITFTGEDQKGFDHDHIVNYLLTVTDQVVTDVEAEDFNPDDDYFFGYKSENYLVEKYLLNLAKYYYARLVLEGNGDDLPGEMNDQDSSVYIGEDALVNYYKNNIRGRFDVNPLIISFSSVLESEQALFKYAIKANSTGQWYKLPNINDPAEFTEIANSNVEDAEIDIYAYAKKLLEEQNIDFNTTTEIDYRTTEYRRFYNSYSIKALRDQALNDTPENNEVLKYFLRIYDDLYQTNYTELTGFTVTLNNSISREQLEEDMKLEYNSFLLSGNTSLRDYIYRTLDPETSTDEDAALHYSKGVQQLSNKPFLVYLLNDDSTDDVDVLDETDEDNVVFQDNDNAQAIRAKALNAVINQRLTSTYINQKTAEKLEDIKIDIYDPIIRESYAFEKEYEGSTGFKNNDVLATVNGEDITVDELFEYLDATVGFTTGLDLIQRKVLRKYYFDQITEEEMNRFQEQFRATLDSFAAGNFESNGFPPSIGKDKFILLAFGAQSVEEAIETTYIQPKLRELYNKDYENHYGEEDNIYQKWAELSALIHDEEVGVTASHLLISIDRDFDDRPDDPNKLDAADLQALELEVDKLIDEINFRAKLSSNMNDGLTKVVDSYNDATRYELTYNSLDPYRDDVWVPFKRLGLELVYQSLGEINNQTNFPNASGAYDQTFFEYVYNIALELKDDLADRDGDKGGLVPLYGPDRSDFTIEKVRTAFGWHLVLFTNISESVSAEVTESDSKTSEFVNPFVSGEDVKLTSENENETLSYEQIMIFIKESEAETGVESLNSTVQNAITRYFNPVKSMYDNNYHRLELSFRLLEKELGGTLTFNNNIMDVKLNNMRRSNINQLFNYAYFDDSLVEDGNIYELLINERYAAIYGNWFDILTN